jgi:predicted secreted protein
MGQGSGGAVLLRIKAAAAGDWNVTLLFADHSAREADQRDAR